jgi:hypothetical protein
MCSVSSDIKYFVPYFCTSAVVPNMALFCSSLISWFLSMLIEYFLNDFQTVPFAPIISGINFVFTFYVPSISVVFIIIIIIVII